MPIPSIPTIPSIPKIPVPTSGTAPNNLPKMPPLPKAPQAIATPGAKVPGLPKPPMAPPTLPKAPGVPTLPTPSVVSSAPTLPTPDAMPKLPQVENVAPTLPSIPDADKQEDAATKLEALKETVGNIQEAAKSKEEAQETQKADDKQEAPAETKPQETPEPTTKKRGRKSKKETAAATQEAQNNQETDTNKDAPKENKAPVSQNPTEEYITIQLKPTCKDFKAMEDAICNTFNDPEWEKLKEELTEANNKIVIETDMNAATLKMAVSDLSKLRNKILSPFYKYQTNFQNLVSDKPEGILERVKRLNSKGSNDYERRRSGIIACMQYEMNGQLINLYELLEQTRERYNFLKSIMESIEYKTKALITMNSAILMEQKLEN